MFTNKQFLKIESKCVALYSSPLLTDIINYGGHCKPYSLLAVKNLETSSNSISNAPPPPPDVFNQYWRQNIRNNLS